MIQPRLEVAEVFREFTAAFLDRYGDTISPDQRRVLWDVARCRTAELGGHIEECDRCGHRRPAYNSCRNRHCPKCQAASRAQWLEDRSTELLPVEYFHVVFTLPHEIGPLALQNQRRIYGMLFQAAAESLLTIAADPRHLGAHIGFLSVLHTWGQNLHLHPHVHCVVPGGGLSLDRSQWIACRPGFFLPVRVLGRLFRAKFLSFLRDAYDRRHISFHGQQRDLVRDRYCPPARQAKLVGRVVVMQIAEGGAEGHRCRRHEWANLGFHVRIGNMDKIGSLYRY